MGRTFLILAYLMAKQNQRTMKIKNNQLSYIKDSMSEKVTACPKTCDHFMIPSLLSGLVCYSIYKYISNNNFIASTQKCFHIL